MQSKHRQAREAVLPSVHDTGSTKRKDCYIVDELLETQRLAARLRRVRLEHGLSLRGAAAKVGVTKETLSDLERARRQPHPPTLAKIAEGYGVEISDLLGPMVEEELALSGKEVEAPEGAGLLVEEPSDEENRRVPLDYLKAWPRYIDRRAEVFERELESFPAVLPLEDMPTLMPRVMEMYDELTDLVSAVDGMLVSVRRPLEQVSEEEKKELRELGEAMDRLMASALRMHVIIESAWARKEEAAASEQRRREHEEKQARLKQSFQVVQGE